MTEIIENIKNLKDRELNLLYFHYMEILELINEEKDIHFIEKRASEAIEKINTEKKRRLLT
ncbi:MAG: hypothetical protein EU541_06925 [Promethearchaeota archaeon]|nr:MAG: hypothetical protein EU541_06925 [Candidatus Lokiarchaeota archaeon]